MRSPISLMASIHIFLLFFAILYPQRSVSIPHNNLTDVESLLAVKSSFVDPDNILGTNWTSNVSFCSWIGVTCGRERVIGLMLNGLNLQGSISPYIGNLSFLSFMSLGNNSLSGPLPETLGQLVRLKTLYLQNNTISGPLPSSFFNMSSLVNASFYSNSLSGSLPSEPETFNLRNLQRIIIVFNNLTGVIPSGFAHCTQLHYLSLYGNAFTGHVPDSISNLTMLTGLELGSNRLTGTIPAFIGNLTNLEIFGMDGNFIEGSIPKELGRLSKLRVLSLFKNNITGPIPLTLLNASMISVIQMASNKLSGTIPVTIGHAFPLLKTLNLRTNRFVGGLEFISSLSNCEFLQMFSIGVNMIEGEFQDSVGNLSTNVQYIYVYQNSITGKISDGFSNLSSLLVLAMQYNELTGEIPSSLLKVKALQALDIGDNKLSGLIPYEIGLLTSLYFLNLEGNELSGLIPNSIGNISGLQYLSLANNKLFSIIPHSFWSLRNLLSLNITGNALLGSLPSELSTLNALSTLDVSNNKLSGNITSALGELQMLEYIDLSCNSFHGDIPQTLGGLVSVEYLNLSHNFLTGSIPENLADLRYLGSLDLSYNELKGQIPEGRVFSNISIPLLKGNAALCGASKLGFEPCSKSIHHSKSKVYLLKYILPPILGIAILSYCFCIILFVRRKNSKMVASPKDAMLNDINAISYIELVRATNNFNDTNLLGKGSVGSVFKACLHDGLTVAVKVMNLEIQGALKSFDVECRALSTALHRNLVKIISTCSNLNFKALVLQYMPNGSLEDWLHSQDHYLNLLQRINILVDVALGLEYLHHNHHHVIVHRDLKPSNVLLDEDMVAHVADFGIAKLLLGDSISVHSVSTPGTIGYMAPEYGYGANTSSEGDVYSFGILLLETLTGKRPSDPMFGGELSLRKWVSEAYPDAVLDIVIYNISVEKYVVQEEEEEKVLTVLKKCASSMIKLGLMCSSDAPKDRIPMRDVVPIMQKIKKEYSLLLRSN